MAQSQSQPKSQHQKLRIRAPRGAAPTPLRVTAIANAATARLAGARAAAARAPEAPAPETAPANTTPAAPAPAANDSMALVIRPAPGPVATRAASRASLATSAVATPSTTTSSGAATATATAARRSPRGPRGTTPAVTREPSATALRAAGLRPIPATRVTQGSIATMRAKAVTNATTTNTTPNTTRGTPGAAGSPTTAAARTTRASAAATRLARINQLAQRVHRALAAPTTRATAATSAVPPALANSARYLAAVAVRAPPGPARDAALRLPATVQWFFALRTALTQARAPQAMHDYHVRRFREATRLAGQVRYDIARANNNGGNARTGTRTATKAAIINNNGAAAPVRTAASRTVRTRAQAGAGRKAGAARRTRNSLGPNGGSSLNTFYRLRRTERARHNGRPVPRPCTRCARRGTRCLQEEGHKCLDCTATNQRCSLKPWNGPRKSK